MDDKLIKNIKNWTAKIRMKKKGLDKYRMEKWYKQFESTNKKNLR